MKNIPNLVDIHIHNFPDGPSSTDTKKVCYELSSILNANSAYLLEYPGLESLDELKKILFDVNEEESTYSKSFLYMNEEFDDNNSDISTKGGQELRQNQIFNSLINYLKPYAGRQPAYNDLISVLATIKEEPETKALFVYMYDKYCKENDKKIGKDKSNAIQIIEKTFEDIFTLEAYETLVKNPRKHFSSNYTTEIKSPKYFAHAVSFVNQPMLNQSNLIDEFMDGRASYKNEAEFYKDLQEKFGIKVTRYPLEELLSEEKLQAFNQLKEDYEKNNPKLTPFLQKVLENANNPETPEQYLAGINKFENRSHVMFLSERVIPKLDIQEIPEFYGSIQGAKQKAMFMSSLKGLITPVMVEKLAEDLPKLAKNGMLKPFLKASEGKIKWTTNYMSAVSELLKYDTSPQKTRQILNEALGFTRKIIFQAQKDGIDLANDKNILKFIADSSVDKRRREFIGRYIDGGGFL